MGADDVLQAAEKGLSVTEKLIDMAGKSPEARQAGVELGKTVLTITKTVNTFLLPLAAINYGAEKARRYFQEKFESDMDAISADIPPECVVEPKSSIAGPAMQGLAYAHEEPDLKAMFLGLLKTSMDGRVSEAAHPAFVEIIKQLSAEETAVLRGTIVSDIVPAAELRYFRSGSNGYNILYKHLLNYRILETNTPIINARVPSMVDNWVRLGLVEAEYGRVLAAPDAYSWVEQRPEYMSYASKLDGTSDRIEIGRGALRRTSFGQQFAEAVGILPQTIDVSPPAE
jgi:hypothetical protein